MLTSYTLVGKRCSVLIYLLAFRNSETQSDSKQLIHVGSTGRATQWICNSYWWQNTEIGRVVRECVWDTWNIIEANTLIMHYNLNVLTNIQIHLLCQFRIFGRIYMLSNIYLHLIFIKVLSTEKGFQGKGVQKKRKKKKKQLLCRAFKINTLS